MKCDNIIIHLKNTQSLPLNNVSLILFLIETILILYFSQRIFIYSLSEIDKGNFMVLLIKECSLALVFKYFLCLAFRESIPFFYKRGRKGGREAEPAWCLHPGYFIRQLSLRKEYMDVEYLKIDIFKSIYASPPVESSHVPPRVCLPHMKTITLAKVIMTALLHAFLCRTHPGLIWLL